MARTPYIISPQSMLEVPAFLSFSAFVISKTHFVAQNSGVAKLGHTGASALAIRGHAPTIYRYSSVKMMYRDGALYICLHFYIIPTLFAYFSVCHPCMFLHFYFLVNLRVKKCSDQLTKAAMQSL